MGMAGVGNRGEVKSEINVTPLVDVCLVLLIIFMVVGPMIGRGPVTVMLPEGENPDKKPAESNQVVLAVKADGSYWFGSAQVSPEELRSTLKEVYERAPGKEIVLKGDSRLQYAAVRGMMRLVAECGFRSFGLAAEKTKR